MPETSSLTEGSMDIWGGVSSNVENLMEDERSQLHSRLWNRRDTFEEDKVTRSWEMQKIAWLAWPDWRVRAATMLAGALAVATPIISTSITMRAIQRQLALFGMRGSVLTIVPIGIQNSIVCITNFVNLKDRVWNEAKPHICPTCLTGRTALTNLVTGVGVTAIVGPFCYTFIAFAQGFRRLPRWRNFGELVAFVYLTNKPIVHSAWAKSAAVAVGGAVVAVQAEIYARDNVLPKLSLDSRLYDEMISSIPQGPGFWEKNKKSWEKNKKRWEVWLRTTTVYQWWKGSTPLAKDDYEQLRAAVDRKSDSQLAALDSEER